MGSLHGGGGGICGGEAGLAVCLENDDKTISPMTWTYTPLCTCSLGVHGILLVQLLSVFKKLIVC